MSYNDPVTSNLADFGARERRMMRDLLQAWDEQGLPVDFSDDDVTVAMNRNSGYVFLLNSAYQVAMMNGDTLESWYSCPNCGHEGFQEDMDHDPENAECTRYLREIGVIVDADEDEDEDSKE